MSTPSLTSEVITGERMRKTVSSGDTDGRFAKCSWGIFLLLCFLIGSATCASAEPETVTPEKVPSAEVVATALHFDERIDQQWLRVLAAVKDGDLSLAEREVLELDKIKLEAGFESLEDFSFSLLAAGRKYAEQGEVARSRLLVRKALQLSPRSPRIRMRALGVMPEMNLPTSDIFSLFIDFWQYPGSIIRVAQSLIYPVLWALTLSLILVLALLFCTRVVELLRGVAAFLPATARGVLAPPFALVLFAAPCYYGPLWTLGVWAAATAVLLPGRRRLAALAGVIVALWGLLIPVRESLHSWIEEIGIRTMLSVSAGDYQPSYLSEIRALARQRADDGVVHYALGQLLRKIGDHPGAEESFGRAGDLLRVQPWTLAQLGTLEYLEQRYDQAKRSFEEAERLGLKSPAFYYTYSKIKFELLETVESRDLFRLANEGDPELVATLRKREDLSGVDAKRIVGEIHLPTKVLVSSAFSDSVSAKLGGVEKAIAIMTPLSSQQMLLFGIALIALAVLSGKRAPAVRLKGYYPGFTTPLPLILLLRVLPGGSPLLAGKPILTFLLFAAAAFLIMPVVDWPSDARDLLPVLGQYGKVYIGGVALVLILTATIGYYLTQGKKQE